MAIVAIISIKKIQGRRKYLDYTGTLQAILDSINLELGMANVENGSNLSSSKFKQQGIGALGI